VFPRSPRLAGDAEVASAVYGEATHQCRGRFEPRLLLPERARPRFRVAQPRRSLSRPHAPPPAAIRLPSAHATGHRTPLPPSRVALAPVNDYSDGRMSGSVNAEPSRGDSSSVR